MLNQQIQQTINVYGIQPSVVPPEPDKPVIGRNLSTSSTDLIQLHAATEDSRGGYHA